jgi:enterochelin esterase-like enzyme
VGNHHWADRSRRLPLQLQCGRRVGDGPSQRLGQRIAWQRVEHGVRSRRIHVCTPPRYETGTQKYPVFYLLHGAGNCDDSWISVGPAGFILDNLIAAQKAKPMIIVMPAGRPAPFDLPPTAAGLRYDDFVNDFVNDIMPYAERHYRALRDRLSLAYDVSGFIST